MSPRVHGPSRPNGRLAPGQGRRTLAFEALEARNLLAIDVQISYEFTRPAGGQVDTLHVGDDFILSAYVRDVRGNAAGVFQAYLDVSYPAAVASPSGPISHGEFYNEITSGSLATAGLLNDIGGRDTDQFAPSPPDDRLRLFSIPFRANAIGSFNLVTTLPTDQNRQTIKFDVASAVLLSEMQFIGASIQIAPVTGPQVSIAAGQNGSEAGPTPGTFTVSQTMTGTVDTVIQYGIGGSASGGTDYTGLSGTVTIPAGQLSATINVPVVNDSTVEAAETVMITLNSISSGPAGSAINQSAKAATITIADNDSAQVSIALTSGGSESGPTPGVVTITQSALSSTNTVISISSAGGSATSGSDYTALPTSVTIPAGQTSVTLNIPVLNDSAIEGGETVLVTLTGITSGNSNITLQAGSTQATVPIADNDSAQVRINGTTAGAEAGTVSLVYTVTQSATSPANTVIAYSLSGSASAGSDFIAPSGSVTILAGQTTATITIPVVNDTLVEANETVIVRLDSITSGQQVSIDTTQDQATLAISDNDSAQVRIAMTTAGNEAGPVSGVFTVTQTAASSTPTTVSYTVTGTATPGSDYTALSGTVTIPAGQTTATITVPVINDSLAEPAETVIVTLDGITAGDPQITVASAAQAQATLSITDNDIALVSIVVTTQGSETGPTAGVLTISQTGTSSSATVVGLTYGGTATSGSDFTALPATVTIPAGQTSVTLTVPVLNDSVLEGPETVIVTLANIVSGNAQLAASGTVATVTIADNESALVRVSQPQGRNEDGGAPALFVITQTVSSPTATVISYTLGGTASGTSDYTPPATSSITIPAGQTSVTITVPILDDAIVEADETIVLTLGSITSGNPQIAIDPAQRERTLTIADDDSATISISLTANGNEDGPSPGLLTVTQSAASSTDTVLSYTVAGSATAGSDYAALSGTVTIPAGQTSATITVTVLDDELMEPAENVIVTLGEITSGDEDIEIHVEADQATVQIVDDETPQVRIVAAADANEDGNVSGRFTVSQNTVTATATVVSLSIGGTATAGQDYEAIGLTVTIPAGETSVDIDVDLLADNRAEGLETVVVRLEEITSGDPGLEIDSVNGEATVEIADDETGLIRIALQTNGSEDGPIAGAVIVTQDGITETDTVVAYTYGGTATPGTDFTASVSRTVTIPAGETSVTLLVLIVEDDIVEGDETIVLTLDQVSEVSPHVSIDVAADEATVTIEDDDSATVGISDDSAASEAGPVPGSFVLTLSAPSSTDTVITYTLTGTATAGEDYTEPSGSVTIPAGETSATISISVLDDNLVEGTEIVTLALFEITGGQDAITIDTEAGEASLEIADNDSALVQVAVTRHGSEAGPTSIVFTVSMTKPSSTVTAVELAISGSATSGSDYTSPSMILAIPAGDTSRNVTVAVLDDELLEGLESLILELAFMEPSERLITIDETQNSATADLVDDETGLIRIAATTQGSEAGPTAGRFTVTQDGITDSPTVIAYAVTGTATAGSDYVTLSGTVTIPAGQTSAVIDVTVLDDQLIEGVQTVVVRLDEITSGDDRLEIDEDADAATVNITDNDTGLVSITAGTGVSEAGPLSSTFTVTQSGISDVPTVISYTISGTAASGSDFTALSGTVTIPAGQTSATITLTALNDALVEGDETVIVTLTGITSGGELVLIDEEHDVATITIADNDSAAVSIAAGTDGNEAGPVSGTFTVTLSSASSTDTVVSYTVAGTATSGSDYTAPSGTVTIPAGQTSVTITVPTLNDTAVEGTETVSVTLTSITSGDAQITLDSQDEAEIDLVDNDSATVGFAAATSSAIEVNGSHAIVVRLSIPGGGTLAKPVTINVSASGGTATSADYTLGTTTVTFPAGSADGAEQNVTVNLTDDGALEADETLVLSLAVGTDGTGGRTTVSGNVSHTVTISDDPITGVISGFVWSDGNGNGQRDDGEMPIMGVMIRLSGTNNQNQEVNRETTTDENGAYAFTDLAGGTYTVTEVQPRAFNDGVETLGTVAGGVRGTSDENVFRDIELGAGQTAADYNFGEAGPSVDFVSLRFFLASTLGSEHVLVNADDINSILVRKSAVGAASAAKASSARAADAALTADAGLAEVLASSAAAEDSAAESGSAKDAIAFALSTEQSLEETPGAATQLSSGTDEQAAAADQSADMLLDDPANRRGIAGGLEHDEEDGDGEGESADAAGIDATDQAFEDEAEWLGSVAAQ